ncbi:MAG: hypothetical protein ACOZIN_18665 [Myxococcota bacterium]
MTKTLLAAALTTTVLLGGCIALGWRFGPGFALTDTPLDEALFSEPPVVVHRGEEYFLTWTQGSYPYFFQPNYKAMDGRLVFALVATSSSGNLAGRHREMKIEGAHNLQALQRGGAYWWQREPEPDGNFVPLKIVEPSPPAPPR